MNTAFIASLPKVIEAVSHIPVENLAVIGIVLIACLALFLAHGKNNSRR